MAGSIAERRSSKERPLAQISGSNASVHVGPDGEIKAVYRKLHMFDVEIEGKRYCESDTDEPGEEIVSSDLADGINLGMAICYDLRFPELFRVLALRGAPCRGAARGIHVADNARPLGAVDTRPRD